MKMFKLWLYSYQTKARNQGNTEAATNPVFDLLITSTTSNDLNDLQKLKCFSYCCAFQLKASRNTVAATNPVLDLLMTSNDLNYLQK